MASSAWRALGARGRRRSAPTHAVVGRASMPSARAPLSSCTPRREEVVLERRRDLGVLLRQHLLAADDQRDLAAERREHVHELDAGDARADHDEVLGELRRRVGVAGGEHALAVDRAPSRGCGAGDRWRARWRRPRARSTPSAVSATTSCGPVEPAGARGRCARPGSRAARATDVLEPVLDGARCARAARRSRARR